MQTLSSNQFRSATRLNQALTARIEKRALQWMAERMPSRLSSDQLTLLGFAAQFGAGAAYALARNHPAVLLLVNFCIVLNWFGDSMDGTLARVRCQQRPRYGFYVDHMADIFGSAALLGGLGMSGYLHWQTAIAMLIGFLLLSGECFLATHSLGRFQMSQGIFGPTELRMLLIAGNLALLRSPYAVVFGHRLLLFDLGGWIGAAGMVAVTVFVAVQHTAQLYYEEPLP
jgi:phosphatidylglycerophosphate synthase